jgi:hypothetical protein
MVPDPLHASATGTALVVRKAATVGAEVLVVVALNVME